MWLKIPSIKTKFRKLDEGIQPQTIAEPPPYLTTGRKFFSDPKRYWAFSIGLKNKEKLLISATQGIQNFEKTRLDKTFFIGDTEGNFEIAEYERKPPIGNIIIDVEVLLNLFLQLSCPRRFQEGLQLSEDSRYGLCSSFVIRCKHCDFYSKFFTSKKILNCPEVNTRFVYGMRQIGKSFSAEFKLCGTLNLPRVSKTAYTNHENKLMSVISEVSELSMQKAASELLVLHLSKNKIVQRGVSIDGTWQLRGYTSMNGCVSALSERFLKCLEALGPETFAADLVCHSNFQDYALKMDAVGASRIFQRSIVKRGLKYTHYYDDGDSKGFISVQDTYGKDSVTKYECFGYV
ncbi:uncharacterized protein TNCV_4089181 [Trichonephila clavipes]|nr:uncharacterized protein TNCV_4089181 [Trichonephila clavipes]